VTAPSPAAQAEPARVAALDAYSRKAAELFKDGREMAARYTEEARKAAAQTDFETLKKQSASLLAAIDRGDYFSAEQGAEKLDALLKSDVISRTVEFLEINARDGASAASQAIDSYLAKPALNPKVKAFFEGLKEDIASIDKQQALKYTSIAVIVAAEYYGGGAGAGHVAGMLLTALFDEKNGIFKQEGYVAPAGFDLMKELGVR
jgi:hypothetical protein